MTDLLPCPFGCVGDAPQLHDETKSISSLPYAWVSCPECFVDGPERPSVAEAIAAWNTRSSPCEHSSAKYPIDPERPGHCNKCGAEVFPSDQRIRSSPPTALREIEQPTEAMWGGLARDIMMWLDMGDKTPRALFAHLERTGYRGKVPQWLRDEPEMKNLDHVPSKGTRCVLIWRAMEEARIAESASS